jgi:hypothetical protein
MALCAAIYGGPGSTRRVISAVRVGLTTGIAALVPLSPWLLKNIYFFGAPFYPYGRIAVSNDSGGISIAAAPSPPGEHLRWMLSSLGNFLWNQVSPLTALLIVAPFVLRRHAQRAALIFLAASLLLWFLYVPYFDPPRYYLGLAAIAEALSVAMLYEAWSLTRLPEMWRRVGMFGYILARTVYIVTVGLGVMSGSLLGQVVRGDVSRDEYLRQNERPYAAETWVNANLPKGDEIAMVNVLTGYYLDRGYLNDWYGHRLNLLEAGSASRATELAVWCRAGAHYAIFDRGDGNPGFHKPDGVRPHAAFAWVHEPGLHPRVLFSANGVDVLSVTPCGAGQKHR